MKEKKDYSVTVEHEYGCWEVYNVTATSAVEARKKAKAKYAKMYFKMSFLKASIN